MNEIKSVLFVCTANTCRSPMAAAILNEYGEGKFKAKSAGIFASSGSRISEYAALTLDSVGINDKSYLYHRAHAISADDMERCDIIVGITKNHTEILKKLFPGYANKIVSLPRDVNDPFAGNIVTYEICYEELRKNIFEMFSLTKSR